MICDTPANNAYNRWHENAEQQHETLCRRCGRCCGSTDGDPCSKLIKNRDGTYSCSDYANRLGQQSTVSGKTFECVPIQDVKKAGGLRPGCGYIQGAGLRV